MRTAIAMRGRERIAIGRGMRLEGAKNVVVTHGLFKLGTGSFPFSDTRAPGRVRVAGRLVIDGSVAVAPGNWWDIGPRAEVKIGNGSFFNSSTKLASTTSITIGEDCAISWDVHILDDDFHDLTIDGKYEPRAQAVTIGDRVMIGAGAMILKGAQIPDGSIVAAGAVVTGRFVEPGSLLAGVPARSVRQNVSWQAN